MADREITQYVEFGSMFDGQQYLTRCICGKTFDDCEFEVTERPNREAVCPKCGRKLYLTIDIHVWEVVEDEDVP